MAEEFFIFAISEVYSSEKKLKDFIRFIQEVHCHRTCSYNDPCSIMIFYNSLKKFFDDDANNWEEKKRYFVSLSQKNKKETIF